MRRSRSDAAETTKRIVSTASRLFLERGIEAVGMRDIAEAAGLTPSGFYRHFESKQQLVAETNDAAFDRLLAMFETRISGKAPADAFETIVSLYLNQSQQEGNDYLCPLSMVGAELSHCKREARETAMDGYQRLVRCVADRLTHLDGSAALAAARGVVSTLVGAVTLSNMAPDKASARSILNDAHGLIRRLAELKTDSVVMEKGTHRRPPRGSRRKRVS